MIKVLPPEVASSPERRARFEREARAASALNDPHICTVHDIGRAGEIDYLVMEFLEGETLAQRLGRGPLPLEEVLAYGCEIARALEKAHRAGIVHRDVKPGNVMLTKVGVKLLDFGLAKHHRLERLSSGDSDSPTKDGERPLAFVRNFDLRSWLILVVLPLVCGLASSAAHTQNSRQNTAGTHGRRSIRAARAESPLVLDGSLNEPAWQQARSSQQFVQKDPQ